MLSGISVFCFAASYGVAVVLEFSRLFVNAAIRNAVMIGFAAAGLFAHTVFIASEVRMRWHEGIPLATWYTGCLVLSWILAAIYLVVVLISRRSTAGLLLLPTSLALIAAAHLFPRAGQVRLWSLIHGWSLLIGLALVVLGFIAGVMYLVQSYRLKHKLPPRGSVWLPSLEKLQRMNERSLYASIGMVGVGLVSGILLNLIQSGSEAEIPWTDPVVLVSLIWLTWLVAVLVFNGVYPPARYGRKVAYLTVGSFLFLGLVLGIVMWSPSDHGGPDTAKAAVPAGSGWSDSSGLWATCGQPSMLLACPSFTRRDR